MSRTVVALLGIALAIPVTAQMNPAAIGGGLVMPSAINAQAKRHGAARPLRQVSPRDAAACADMPAFRRELGARDPEVLQLERLCRKAGYPIGG